ncbi:hypothetical protein J5N97_010882 [Dioscorea zingiberensis]|uniref:Core-2/I-branching beta-1,6-N-acetylglucosaminyltransferase family protein n=1 Tax=Dioscorea zingiberensis TaxID=325984 RepID=A0A9D5D153_9LILI|nr:hypothetical protein J5N97_010882 [Dioscorea zingiberensis]
MLTLPPFLLLLLSIPIILFLTPQLLLPKTLTAITTTSDLDELDDLNLFQRATTLSSPDLTSPVSTHKIAFLFLTNSNLTFSPLWDLFFSSHAPLLSVYVHADPSSPFLLPPSPSFRLRLIPSKPTARAHPSLISAARRLLAFALLDDPRNAFFAILSQHCIPLRPFPSLHRALFSPSPSQSFIEILPPKPSLWPRYIARGATAMLPEIPFSRFRVGSQFFALTRRHASLVVRDRVLWPKFRLPCLPSSKHSCYPEEHYFPTLLSMMDPKGCTGYTLTRVNWTFIVDGHPHLYSPEEISPELVRKLRKSDSGHEFMFARKFSPGCLKPLMEIAKSVILKED